MRFANGDDRSQLEKDIESRCFEKLRRWARDVVELHDMAELGPKRATDVLISGMLTGLVHTLTDLRVDPTEAAKLLETAMRHQYVVGGDTVYGTLTKTKTVKKKN